MAAPFPVIDVSNWEVNLDETGGAEEKVWLQQPDSDIRWLFKPTTIKGTVRHGDDWAEKASSELAKILALPCADVELAQCDGRDGIISKNLRPPDCQLQPGQVFLDACGAPNYLPGPAPGRPGHSIANIKAALVGVKGPPGATPEGFEAFDFFAGYLLFDAWIANRDRHDENWAVLIPEIGTDPIRLCGSYDQANSLGYNVQATKAQALLADADHLTRWVERGTAWRFEHDPEAPPPTLVATAHEALAQASPAARDHWLGRLGDARSDIWDEILHRIAWLSDPSRTLASKILDLNRRRLLDEQE